MLSEALGRVNCRARSRISLRFVVYCSSELIIARQPERPRAGRGPAWDGTGIRSSCYAPARRFLPSVVSSSAHYRLFPGRFPTWKHLSDWHLNLPMNKIQVDIETQSLLPWCRGKWNLHSTRHSSRPWAGRSTDIRHCRLGCIFSESTRATWLDPWNHSHSPLGFTTIHPGAEEGGRADHPSHCDWHCLSSSSGIDHCQCDWQFGTVLPQALLDGI